jgi:hypothetical protein
VMCAARETRSHFALGHRSLAATTAAATSAKTPGGTASARPRLQPDVTASHPGRRRGTAGGTCNSAVSQTPRVHVVYRGVSLSRHFPTRPPAAPAWHMSRAHLTGGMQPNLKCTLDGQCGHATWRHAFGELDKSGRGRGRWGDRPGATGDERGIWEGRGTHGPPPSRALLWRPVV